MLVLRRRPNEAIVFSGGLELTLLSVSTHAAWLRFSAPERPPIELSLPTSATDGAEIGIRSPASLARRQTASRIELAAAEEADPDAVLLLTRKPGAALEIGWLSLVLSSIEEERVYLQLQSESLDAAVTLSIVSASTVDARIGVSAPGELRVYRKEVLAAMEEANTKAAQAWSEDDLAALSSESPN